MKQGQPHQENCHYNFKWWSCDWLLLIVCEAWSTSSGELPLLNLHLTLPMTLHAPSRSQFVFITSINRLYLDKLPTLVSFIINISGYIVLIHHPYHQILPMENNFAHDPFNQCNGIGRIGVSLQRSWSVENSIEVTISLFSNSHTGWFSYCSALKMTKYKEKFKYPNYSAFFPPKKV